MLRRRRATEAQGLPLPRETVALLGDEVKVSRKGPPANLLVGSRSLFLTGIEPDTERDTTWTHGGDGVLCVGQYHVELYAVEGSALSLRWRGRLDDLAAMLQLRGGIWKMMDTDEWAIMSHTVAIDLPKAGGLGRRTRATSRNELVRKFRPLTRSGYQLQSLMDLHNELFADSPVQIPTEKLRDGSLRMSPDLSSILDRGARAIPPGRGDYIRIERLGRASTAKFHEFRIQRLATDDRLLQELDRLTYNVLYLMGIRRSKLFRLAYGERLFTIALPPALLKSEQGEHLAIVPILMLTRLPRMTSFRRTVTVTFVTVPLKIDAAGVRPTRRVPTGAEVAAVADEFAKATEYFSTDRGRKFAVSGALADYAHLPETLSIPELMVRTLETVVQAFTRSKNATLSALRGLRESSISSVCYLVPWVDREDLPWVRWCGGETDELLESEFHRLVFWDDYGERTHAFSTSETVDFPSLSIGNAHGADMSGLTLYNPQLNAKFVLYPARAEAYPNHSVLRWFAWQVYLDAAISSVRSLLGRFHDTIDNAVDLRTVLSSAQDLGTELSEVYDLDLADFFYRREYETLRGVLRLNDDYEYMRGRLAEAQGQSSLREQIMMNNLVLALTLSGLLATTTVAVGQAMQWPALWYAISGVLILAVALGISIGVLEPAQRLRAIHRARKRKKSW